MTRLPRRSPRPPEPPPWLRWVVFTPRGEPTGWAMGTSEGTAKMAWIDGGRFGRASGPASFAARWAMAEAEGYTVRPVLLHPSPAGQEGEGRSASPRITTATRKGASGSGPGAAGG